MPSILSVQNFIVDLSNAQNDILAVFNAAARNVESDKNTAARLLKSAVDRLVPTDNDARYAELSAALSGFGPEFDFTARVKQWRAMDKDNRTEYRNLEGRWGQHERLKIETGALREELEDAKTALERITPQIHKFDETTKKIQEHNAAYPKAQITEENHDGYEKFGFWRFMGWLTFLNRGPHKAYQVINDYTKKYGDFYEDARDIHHLRDEEKTLLDKTARQEKDHAAHSGALQQMDRLNASLRGPEKMAADIRAVIVKMVVEKPAFADALLSAMPQDDNAVTAVTEATKIYAYGALSSALYLKQSAAKSAHGALVSGAEDITYALGKVSGKIVQFDTHSLDEVFNKSARTSKEVARTITIASDSLEEYKAKPGTAYNALFDHITGIAQEAASWANNRDNKLHLDFSSLQSQVRRHVNVYNEEQRLRELELQRERRHQQELQRLRNSTSGTNL